MAILCKNCGEVSSFPKIEYEDPSPGGVSLPPGAYEYAVCPKCGDRDIANLVPCDTLGCVSSVPEGSTRCSYCKNDLKRDARILISALTIKYSPASKAEEFGQELADVFAEIL